MDNSEQPWAKGLAAAKATAVAGKRPDKWTEYERMHRSMTKNLGKLIREEEKDGVVNREITDRIKEYRMGLAQLTEYLNTRSDDDSAAEFFARLDVRLHDRPLTAEDGI